MKDMITKKRKLLKFEIVSLTEKSSVRLQLKFSPKSKNPRCFTLPTSIGNSSFINGLCGIDASVNLIPYSIYWKLRL